MAFRTVTISTPAELHAKGGQLQIWRDDKISVPMEDIAVLVVESPRVKMSAACLAILSEHDVMTIVCGGDHQPAAYLCPYLPHSRQPKIAQQQFGMSLPLRKRLWQRIVKQKIDNQANALDYVSCEKADSLREYCEAVVSGDTTNREGQAARLYFPNMFDGLNRRDESEINSALNYGYAIVRAAIARSLISHGLYPPLGLHHRSEYNNFNLADDLIEPFRPFVDVLVKAYPPENAYLSKEDREKLLAILHCGCLVDGRNMSVLSGIEASVSSLVSAINNKDASLLMLPEFCELIEMTLD